MQEVLKSNFKIDFAVSLNRAKTLGSKRRTGQLSWIIRRENTVRKKTTDRSSLQLGVSCGFLVWPRSKGHVSSYTAIVKLRM